MANRYRACIVGLSGIGAGKPSAEGPAGLGQRMPHSHADAYCFHRDTEIVGVCDLVQEKIDDFFASWGDEVPEAKGYTDYKEMIDAQKPDLLSVVTSDNRHADIVVYGAQSGVRGIYCEKPIATTLADADRMIEAVEASGTVMSINHTRRWLPIFHQVKQELEDGTIGELKRIVHGWGGPRAMLFRNGTHRVDIVCFLAGSDPEWVWAELDEGYEDYWPYQGDGGRNPDLEPGCSGYIHFKNGVRAFYNGTKNVRPRHGYELTGTKGYIFLSEQTWDAEIHTEGGARPIANAPLVCFDSASAVRELIHAMENGGQTISPPREARKTLEVLLGFMASQKKGNVRVDFPLDENAV